MEIFSSMFEIRNFTTKNLISIININEILEFLGNRYRLEKSDQLRCVF